MYIFSGTPSRDRRIKRDSGLARPFLFLQKNICFAVQIPRKLDICMKTYIILSSKNDSSILDRQVRDCPDVSEKTVPQRIPRRYKEDIKRLQEKYDLHEGWSLMCPSKNSGAYVKGIIQRSKPTWD